MKRLVLFISMLLLAAPVMAAQPYVVSGVTVDVTADNAVDARNQAMKEAQRKAFINLATQLSPDGIIPEVSDRQIGNMVRDLRIEEEKFSHNRYVARYQLQFLQSPVLLAFGNIAIPTPYELAMRVPAATPAMAVDNVQAGSSAAIAENKIETGSAEQIIADIAAQPLPPAIVPVAADNPMPPGVDTNAPIKMLLIESAVDNVGLQSAQEKLRSMPGVVDLTYGASQRIMRLAYRGDTVALIDGLGRRGVRLQAKAPTQPPLYTLQP
jgi:hypothetical protein